MIHRRLSLRTILAFVILTAQFMPFGSNVGIALASIASASPCNSAAFVSDVSVPDGSPFAPGAAFVKTWRLKNTGSCNWTSAYSLAFVSGDPMGATTSRTIPTTAPGQTADLSLDMNAPTTLGHYRGYWMLKDAQGNKLGLGANADRPFWVDINVSNVSTPTPTPMTGLIIQGTVSLNGVGLPGVRIYRSFAGYGGVLSATTGADGKYKADFVFIPGDEMVTVWAELAGYTFDPAKSFWRHYHGLENTTIDFKATAASTAPPPAGGAAFDFTKEVCAATWKSGAGTLPCPGSDGDARGFVLKVDSPRLESGVLDSAPGLLVSPQNKYDGYIQGFFPAYTVQTGDHFRTSVGCAYGSSCYATYRLDYQIDNGAINIAWSWPERNEGRIYQLDKDLSALAGKKVNFILTLLATGSAANDRAIWGQPRIVHSGGTVPTGTVPTDTPITPVPTTGTPPTVSPPPPSTGVLLDFAADACAASWKSGAGALPCPGTDGDARGFVLPVSNPRLENGAIDNAAGLVLFPQNKYDGYIQGTYPEITIQRGDRFQGIVNCAYGSSCYVTFRLDIQVGSEKPAIFWSWQEKNEGQFYRVDKDLSALAGKKVKFTLTILASGTAAGDRALWGQPRIVRTGSVPTTPPPTTPPATDTPVPPGSVTEVKTSAKIPEFVNCASILTAELLGSITTSGPAAVKYHWEISGPNNYTTSESTLDFSSAATQPANMNVSLGCGSYTARLVVTSPNAISGQSEFTLSIPTVLPIYDFNTFKVIGTLSCSEFTSHTWRQEACNGESGGCWISQSPLFENNYAGFFRHDGNTICGLNLP